MAFNLNADFGIFLQSGGGTQEEEGRKAEAN